MKKPNIILCTCDQLRAFETGCYGNSVIRTPNLDRLAVEGVRFETAVTNFPVCMAARSVLLSGQYNRTCTGGVSNVSRKGTLPEYPDPGRPHLRDTTLAEILRSAGYHTRVIGKWHIHSWPHDIGFDDYLIPRVHHVHTGQSYTNNGGPEFVPEGYSVNFEAERVEKFLTSQKNSTDPFFLYYNISLPHCPLDDAPEEYTTMYRPEDIPLRDNVDPDKPLDRQEHWFRVYRWDFRYYDLNLPYTWKLPEGYSLRHLIAEYYGMTTWMDAALGRMMNALESAGLAEDTIVVFTSDHGDNLGSHGLVQKGGPNEEAIRIPYVIRGPGADCSPTVVNSHVASLVDIAPTLLSMAGLDTPEHFHGRNLTPLLNDEETDVETAAFVETGSGAGIRSLDHLYYLPFENTSERRLAAEPSQFYCIQADPFQMKNLAQTRSQSEPAGELDVQLRRWDASTPWMKE
mgnify:CR=1 FL=1